MKAAPLRKTIALCMLTTVLLCTLPFGSKGARAQSVTPHAGSLDTSFGSGGKVVTDFGSPIAEGQSLAVQPDGKLVVAGRRSNNDGTIFALARYNSDGSLDPSFGSGGRVTTAFPQGESEITAMALQQDGKIVAAGDTGGGANHGVMAVARYNPDGTLDQAFGTAGQATVDFGAGFHTAYAIGIQPDGKIVLAGTASLLPPSFTASQFGLARLNPNGTLDPGFGNGGLVIGPSMNAVNGFRGLAVLPDGKIVASGFSGPTRPLSHWTVVRYHANGGLDTGFGIDGAVTTDALGLNASGRSALVLADGKLIVAGIAFLDQGDPTIGLARYNTDGTLDVSFGSGGQVTTPFPGGAAFGTAATLQPDGKILVTGEFQSTPTDSSTRDFALARYNSDGSLDQGFGVGGLVTTDFNSLYDEAWGVAVQPDGNIVVAGESQKTPDPNSTIDFAVVRYFGGSPAFSLSSAPSTVTGDRGTKVKITISINRSAGFTGSVGIAPPDSAQGIKFKPPDAIATTDSSVAFKVKISGSAPTGPQRLTFVGTTNDGQISTATITLSIQ
jgi:uncharacterized delta-60 repeat protein